MLLVYVLFALDMLNISLCIPVFNKHVLSLGGSIPFIGLIGTCSAIISLFWRPITGSLSDTKGRKSILMWCLIPSLIGNILTYLSTSLYPFFFARLLCAFGTPVQTILRTIGTDLISAKKADASIFNTMGALFAACFMGGAVVSGFISEYPRGVELVFLLTCLNVVVSIAVANLLSDERPVPKDSDKEETSKPGAFQKFHDIYKSIKQLKWSRFWDIFTAKGLVDLSFGLMQMNIGLVLLNHFHVEGRYISYMFLVIGVTSLFTQVVLVKFINNYYKNDNYLKIIHASILLAASFIGLGLAPVYLVFLSFVVTLFISKSILDTAIFEVVNSIAGENEKGTVVSLFDGMMSLAEIISPILSTILVLIVGEKTTLLLGAVPVSIGAILTYKKSITKENVD